MKATYEIKHVYIKASSAVVGPLEKEGELGIYMDKTYEDNYCGEDNWEKAEIRLFQDAIDGVMKKANIKEDQVNAVFGGDLINQNVIGNFALRDYDIPYIGMYGACSTAMETLLTASLMVDREIMDTAIAVTSSHNKTAERQFRYPTEYGNKRAETATYTVTGAGAACVSRDPSDIKITSVTIGRVIDGKEKSVMDIGSAMAPAASDTIYRHLKDLNIEPSYYDMIVTGDLSEYGSKVLVDILKDRGMDLTGIHDDCGNMIYSNEQKRIVKAGGSGCACSAVVTYGYLFQRLKQKQIKRLLVLSTGALFSPVTSLQKETIPAIAHAVAFERVGD